MLPYYAAYGLPLFEKLSYFLPNILRTFVDLRSLVFMYGTPADFTNFFQGACSFTISCNNVARIHGVGVLRTIKYFTYFEWNPRYIQ